MANTPEITVGVKLSVSKDTADACLKIVEMYCNEKLLHIQEEPYLNGEIALKYVPLTTKEDT